MRFLCSIALVATVLATGRAAESHSTNTALAADLKKFKLAPGLKAEVVAAEPLLQNPVAFSLSTKSSCNVKVERCHCKMDFNATTAWTVSNVQV